MEKFNLQVLDDRDRPKYILQVKHGSLQNAARKMQMDLYRLSRIVNGAEHSLEDHLKILQYMGILEGIDYTLPRLDMDTFLKLNRDVINNKLKAELELYYKEPKKIAPGSLIRKDHDINFPHKQGELFKPTGLYGCSCHPFDTWEISDYFHKQTFKKGDMVQRRCNWWKGYEMKHGKKGIVLTVPDKKGYLTVKFQGGNKLGGLAHVADLVKESWYFALNDRNMLVELINKNKELARPRKK